MLAHSPAISRLGASSMREFSARSPWLASICRAPSGQPRSRP
jgi:hypothetical protein